VTTQPDEIEELIDARAAGAIMGLSPKRVLTLAREGKLTYIRFGPQTIRFRPSDVQEFASRREERRVDTATAARMLGLTREALLEAVDAGEVRATRVSERYFRFDVEDLVAFMDRHRVDGR